MNIFHGIVYLPRQKKSFILILITALLLGGVSGGFIYYLWPHKEEVSYLNKRIAYLQEAQMKLNYIESKYPEWRKMLKDADQAYNSLERENLELREQLQAVKKSQSDETKKEELSPGYNSCLKRANNDFDMKDCSQAALEYWDKKLNTVYKKAISICNRSTNPKDCVELIP